MNFCKLHALAYGFLPYLNWEVFGRFATELAIFSILYVIRLLVKKRKTLLLWIKRYLVERFSCLGFGKVVAQVKYM